MHDTSMIRESTDRPTNEYLTAPSVTTAKSHTLTNGSVIVMFREQGNGLMLVTRREDGSMHRRTMTKDAARKEWTRLLANGFSKW